MSDTDTPRTEQLRRKIMAMRAGKIPQDEALELAVISHLQLERELAQARQDAERYRWLRDKSWRQPFAPGPLYVALYDGISGDAEKHDLARVWLRYGSSLDAAIDAAMKEQK